MAETHGTSAVRPRSVSWFGRAFAVCAPLWLASRLVFLVIAAFVDSVHRLPGGRPGTALAWPVWVYARFDAGHFARIERVGYYRMENLHRTWDEAFFPGYPFLSRWLAELLSDGRPTQAAYLAGLALVSWISVLVAAVLLWRLVSMQADEILAGRSVIVMLFGPYAVFFMASYSEGLFLALAVATWLAGRSQRWWLASTLAALACTVRINGLFLAAGLLVMYFVAAIRERQPWLRWPLLAFGLPIVPPLVYFWWLRRLSGTWTTWLLEEEYGWGRRTVAPWASLRNSIRHLHGMPTFGESFQSWMELLFAGLLVLALWLLATRRAWPEFTYVGLSAASLLTSTVYLSIPRSLLVCFPVFSLAAEWSTTRRRRGSVTATCFACAGVLVINATTFLTNQWTG